MDDTLCDNKCNNINELLAANPDQINYNTTELSSYPVSRNKNSIENNEQPTTTAAFVYKTHRCSCLSADRLNQIRKKVEDAIRERKTFTIKGGFQWIRNGLMQRGWVEKIEFRSEMKNVVVSNPPTMDEVCCNLPVKLENETIAVHVAKCEKMIVSRLLQHHDVDFYWNMRKESNEWQHRLNKNKILNRFSRSLFTSKEGLCLLLQQMYWHTQPGVAYVRFPRTYTINFADQCTTFVEDFRLTACISLLKWFTQNMHEKGEYAVCSDDGKVPISAIQFALDRCNEYVATEKHLDLDRDFHKVWDHEWEQFLTNFALIAYDNGKFSANGCYSLLAYETSAKSCLKNIIPYWPQIELDGLKNIWIMKPGNKCRGRDIILIKDMNDVIKVMNHKLKYIVQKYIERPLLIYKTKFDIRQWFILTCVQPLTIWMYRDCYLRFSSKKFSLDDFHESVHLTNHAVQHKYTNHNQDKSLPNDRMWDNHTFQAYLRQIGHADKWFKVIFPGMRECIIGAMLASQETMDRRPNTFELYGADFMIAENFSPWLIEINSCPAMGPTTSVTARMCPQCYEDLIKVVIDRRRDPKSETGLFELIYRQILPQTPAYLGMTLSVRGRKIFKKRSSGRHKQEKRNDTATPEPNRSKYNSNKSNLQKIELIKNYNGPVIGNLIEELHASLFKTTVEEVDATPSSPIKIKPAVPHTPKTRKPTYKQRSNTSVSSIDRKTSNVIKRNRSSHSSNNHHYHQNNMKQLYPGNQKMTSTPVLTSTSTLIRSFDLSKSKIMTTANKSLNNIWEQKTATKSSNNDVKIFDTNYVTSITEILPQIETKHCHNLLTVGLGYKNICSKPFVKETIIFPMKQQQQPSGRSYC